MTADYLVTGGTGFIGLNLLQTLQGERVIISRDHHNYPWTQKVLQRAHVCNGNLNELDFANRVVSRYQPRVIFDLASISMVRAGLKQPAHTYCCGMDSFAKGSTNVIFRLVAFYWSTNWFGVFIPNLAQHPHPQE